MTKWIKKNRREFLLIAFILILAAFLRFYKIDQYMTFLGDEGRDAIIVKSLLVDGDLPFIGPPTSVGNLYLGPLYYYIMAVSMAIFWLNPVAASGMVAIIGVAAVGLIYYLVREWFGKYPALVSSFLYAVSPVNIHYSSFSWNPNPTPFFSLLALLGFYKAHQSQDFRWLILSGGALAAALQMHYLTLILLAVAGVWWLMELLDKKSPKRFFAMGTLGAALVFWVLMLPLVLFDFRHNFLNFRGIQEMFFGSGEAVSFNLISRAGEMVNIFNDLLVGRYMAGENWLVALIVSIMVVVTLLISAKMKIGKKDLAWPYKALGVWLILGLIGLSFYKNDIYDHYLGFLNPAPYFLIGGLIGYLKGKWQVIAALAAILVLGLINLQKNPLFLPPNNQLGRTQQVAKFIINQSGDMPFNFALLAKSNYDSAYQYYLDLYGHKPKVVPVERTAQLFVVCEDEECLPINNPKYEISAYGWAKIEWEKEVEGVKVFKLIPNPSGK